MKAVEGSLKKRVGRGEGEGEIHKEQQRIWAKLLPCVAHRRGLGRDLWPSQSLTS